MIQPGVSPHSISSWPKETKSGVWATRMFSRTPATKWPACCWTPQRWVSESGVGSRRGLVLLSGIEVEVNLNLKMCLLLLFRLRREGGHSCYRPRWFTVEPLSHPQYPDAYIHVVFVSVYIIIHDHLIMLMTGLSAVLLDPAGGICRLWFWKQASRPHPFSPSLHESRDPPMMNASFNLKDALETNSKK